MKINISNSIELKFKPIFWLIIVFFLSPIIFFPISTDLSIFVQAGKAIASGQKIYVEFIDLKQPLIYYIFALFHLVTGSSEIGLRLIDFFLQLTTVIFLFRLIYKNSGKETTAYLSAMLYSISYSTLNFNQTMQIESFAGIGIVFLIRFLLKEEKSKIDYLLAGALSAILTSLKITFGSIIFAFLIWDFYLNNTGSGRLILRYLLMSISFISVFLICSLPLFDPQIWSGYMNALQYLSFYSSLPPINAETLGTSLKTIAIFFGDNLSLLIVVSVSTAMMKYLRKRRDDRLTEAAFLVCLALFVGIAVERKFYEYHFVRIYVPIMILAGVGFSLFLGSWKEAFIRKNRKKVLIAVISIIVLLPLSPLPRFYNLQKSTIAFFADKEEYNTIYERAGSSVIIRKQHLEIAGYVNAHRKPGERLILMSTASAVPNYFFDGLKLSRFSLSCFYLGYAEIPDYMKMIKDEISLADWIVVQNNDGNFHAFGHNNSSYDMLRIKRQFSYQIMELFDEEIRIGNFIIYRKKS